MNSNLIISKDNLDKIAFLMDILKVDYFLNSSGFFIKRYFEGENSVINTGNSDINDSGGVDYVTTQKGFTVYVSNNIIDGSGRKSNYINEFLGNINLTIQEMQNKIKRFLDL